MCLASVDDGERGGGLVCGDKPSHRCVELLSAVSDRRCAWGYCQLVVMETGNIILGNLVSQKLSVVLEVMTLSTKQQNRRRKLRRRNVADTVWFRRFHASTSLFKKINRVCKYNRK